MNYKQCDTAPLVIGGVYEKVGQNGLKQRVAIRCGAQAVDGTWRGEAIPFEGQPFEMVENTETMSGWALVAAPQELSAPILSDDLYTTAQKRLEKENAVLQQRIKQLEKRKKAEEVTSKEIVDLIDKHNKSFSAVAKMFDIHHSTIRKMYREAKEKAA